MIVLDTSIVLETLERRTHYEQVVQFLEANKTNVVAVSPLTLSNIFYLIGNNKTHQLTAEKLLNSFKILGVDDIDASWAFDNYDGSDFEDALQVASAIRNKASVFVAIDKVLANKYGKYLKIYTLFRIKKLHRECLG